MYSLTRKKQDKKNKLLHYKCIDKIHYIKMDSDNQFCLENILEKMHKKISNQHTLFCPVLHKFGNEKG